MFGSHASVPGSISRSGKKCILNLSAHRMTPWHMYFPLFYLGLLSLQHIFSHGITVILNVSNQTLSPKMWFYRRKPEMQITFLYEDENIHISFSRKKISKNTQEPTWIVTSHNSDCSSTCWKRCFFKKRGLFLSVCPENTRNLDKMKFHFFVVFFFHLYHHLKLCRFKTRLTKTLRTWGCFVIYPMILVKLTHFDVYNLTQMVISYETSKTKQ